MLAFDGRAARYTWTAMLVVLGAWLVYQIRSTLFLFILAILFAYLLAPLVGLLDRFLPGRNRTPALLLSYVLVVGLVVLAGVILGTRVVEEATQLGQNLPTTMAQWQATFERVVPEALRPQIEQRLNELIGSLPKLVLQVLAVASNVIYLVIIPILAFFWLKDGAAIRQHVLGLIDPGPRKQVLNEVLADMHLLLAHYMRALLMLSAVTLGTYSIFFTVIGIPYAILLGAMAAALEFIPMVGPLTAGITVMIVAAASGAHTLAALIFLVVFRLCQDYLISPHLMRQGVELHPLLVLFGVFAGAELAGIAGTFLSVPVLASARVVYLRLYRARLALRGVPEGG